MNTEQYTSKMAEFSLAADIHFHQIIAATQILILIKTFFNCSPTLMDISNEVTFNEKCSTEFLCN